MARMRSGSIPTRSASRAWRNGAARGAGSRGPRVDEGRRDPMTLDLKPLHPLFAAEASGIDLGGQLGDEDRRAIERAMDRFAVLVFRDQPLDQDQQIAFAKSFGTLDIGLRRANKGPHRFKYDELIDISNVAADGKIAARDSRRVASMVANQLWHSDSSFQQPAARYSMLSAVVLPASGGDTEFADLRAAYEALPEGLKASDR